MKIAIGIAILVVYVWFLVIMGRRLGRETPSFKQERENLETLDRYSLDDVERALDLANRHVVRKQSVGTFMHRNGR